MQHFPVIPSKSEQKYKLEYSRFEEWCKIKKVRDAISEKILLTSFSVKAETNKPSTLWTRYSTLRTTIALKRKEKDISKYTQLLAFLKQNGDGYKAKKSNVFSKNEIHRFLQEANDDRYLMIKVSLIIGIFGACRREELTSLKLTDIEDKKTFIKITIPNTKTKVIREFAITKGNITGYDCLDIFRKYFHLRPKAVTHDRFFHIL